MDSFLTFINQQTWDLARKRTLLTVSGGMDSVTLAHLFYQNNFPAAIAHCNFGLRGEASNLDEAFVKQLAADYGFDFYTRKFNVNAYKKVSKVSTQMAARDLRYKWFEEIRKENGFNWIATAHHIDDSFETTLLNLTRGTSLPGLTGISVKNGYLIRPLLQVSRKEIEQYAQQHHLHWREDESNASDDYSRNLIRHKVTPILKQLNPSLEKTFADTAERLTAADTVLRFFVEDWKKKHLRNENGNTLISIPAILKTVSPSYFLWAAIQEFGFNYAQKKQILTALEGTPGKMFHSGTHTLLCDRDDLIISEKSDNVDEALVIRDLEGVYQLDKASFRLHLQDAQNRIATTFTEKNTAHFAAEMIQLPLKLRRWKTGDKFAPFGMQGKMKKVSDLFTELKLSRFDKESVWLLENGNGDIIWVAGLRTDERYKVTETTSKVFVATFQRNF